METFDKTHTQMLHWGLKNCTDGNNVLLRIDVRLFKSMYSSNSCSVLLSNQSYADLQACCWSYTLTFQLCRKLLYPLLEHEI